MTTSPSASATQLGDFVDLNFARRREMAETLTPDHVQALQRFAPQATSEIIAGGTAVFGGRRLPRQPYRWYGALRAGDVRRH
jgi:hypothetical protein